MNTSRFSGANTVVAWLPALPALNWAAVDLRLAAEVSAQRAGSRTKREVRRMVGNDLQRHPRIVVPRSPRKST